MSDYVIAVAVVDMVMGIYVETSITMVAPMAVDSLAPTVGSDACVDCACEEGCDDCDDAEVPLLLVEPFLSRLYHFLNACTDKYFSRKSLPKTIIIF